MGYGSGTNPGHLGEGDWLVIAEHAYNAWRTQYMSNMAASFQPEWKHLVSHVRSAWVASVKETSEQLKRTLLR